MTLMDRTRMVLARSLDVYRGTPYAERLAGLHERLDQPLRVAVAGRVKAGKSTLLNALVGERLAPTDAGECTRIVTWYEDGHTYQVRAHLDNAAPRQLRFARENGQLDIDLGELKAEDVKELVVTWPAQALRAVTLVDTPGIGSLTEAASRRTWDLLVPEEEETPADAVVYLMRHLHAGDVEFLRAFHDSEVSRPSPVNAIGVLSRADEIAVGRLDSMASARRVASRLGADPNVRRLVQSVIPIAGLLAETAVTLTEEEVGQLRLVADLEVPDAEELLLSADRFVSSRPELGLTELERTSLLDRFGVFGVRLATTMLRRGVAGTATDLARELAERSGLNDLQDLLSSLFFERRDVLKCRSALLAVAEVLRARTLPGSDAVAAEVESVVASAHPFNELRVLSGVRSGWVSGKEEVVAELERVIGGAGGLAHQRLRLPSDAPGKELTAAATDALTRWQRRAENPLTTYELAVAARVAVRSCEGMLADLSRH
ncbi:MAG: dynamin family protein [Actinophytocola sp.]|uniref:dynamin family protein n=1 Tax=Actinophytocola sp. TaxID=1872138 RepID=UPI003D6A6B72